MAMADNDEMAPRKAAIVGVVGRTNAGKSTLVNRMVGEKVTIVSPVEQTTRNTIRGIVEDPRGQLVLLDTPGLHKAVGPLGKLLNGMARASSAGTDILLVVFDAAHEPQLEDEGWMRRVAKEQPEKCVFALNKCDRSPFYETMFRDLWKEVLGAKCLVPGAKCLVSGAELKHQDLSESNAPSTKHQAQSTKHKAPIWVKACGVKPGGCDALMDVLYGLAEPGPALFPDDIVTDYPRKLAIADVVREKLIQHLHDEVPHEVGVLVEDIDERKGCWNVAVSIYVNRPSQKGIVIGQRGCNLRAVRMSACPELSDMFGVKVNIELWVKVEPNWMKNNRLLAEMGYLGAEL
jgi:GTP-binding protein Era